MKKVNLELVKIIISLILFILSFFLVSNIKFIILFLSYVIVSYELFIRLLKNILKGNIFNEEFLMCTATIGAFIIKEYYEGVAVMLFYSIGEYLNNLAIDSSKNKIIKLMDLRSDKATLYNNGTLKVVAPNEVNVGDLILVKPGEKIPLDGIIIKGNTKVDMASITGESLPRSKKVGDSVLSGTINLNGLITIKVTTLECDSTVSKILKAILESDQNKADTEKFFTKFSKIYTPIVMFLALMILLVPVVIFNQDFNTWLYRSLVFLVTSCPCALVLSIPLSFFCGIGLSSKQGILVKSSSVLDNISKVNHVCLDKTGTLTKGNFKVTKVVAKDVDATLRLAAISESFSNHPIAESIKLEYGKAIDKDEILSYKEIDGGIIAKTNDFEIIVGNNSLLHSFNMVPPVVDEVGTIVHVVANRKYVGTIIICDELKDSSLKFISYLYKKGIKITMLSGDNEEVVRDVCNKLKIDDYYANMLPNEKFEIIKSLSNDKKVMFIGDGVNDAPAMSIAYIGVAMGGAGSDAAIETSDVVIMNDAIEKASRLFDLSIITKRKVRQNIIFALSVKAIVLLLGACGLSTILMAVFADIGVTIITIINAILLLFKRVK